MDKPTKPTKLFISYLREPLVLTAFTLWVFFQLFNLVIRQGKWVALNEANTAAIIHKLIDNSTYICGAVIVFGFTLRFSQEWRLHHKEKNYLDAAHLQAEKLPGPLQLQFDVKDDQIKALTDALEALPQQTGFADASHKIKEAGIEIASGKTAKAQAIYCEVLQQKKAEGETANREAAEVARRLGALAFLDNTVVALAAYREAVLLEPENDVGWNQLGRLLHRTGDIDEAIRAYYTQVGDIGRKTDNQALIAVSYGNLGIVLYKIWGDLDQAEVMHLKSLSLFDKVGAKPQIAQAKQLLDDI